MHKYWKNCQRFRPVEGAPSCCLKFWQWQDDRTRDLTLEGNLISSSSSHLSLSFIWVAVWFGCDLTRTTKVHTHTSKGRMWNYCHPNNIYEKIKANRGTMVPWTKQRDRISANTCPPRVSTTVNIQMMFKHLKSQGARHTIQTWKKGDK